MRDHFKVIRKMAWEKYFESEKKQYGSTKKNKKKKLKAAAEEAAWKKYEAVHPEKLKCDNFPSSNEDLQAEQEEEIITELYPNLDNQKRKIPPMPPFPFKPLQDYTSNIENLLAQTYLDRMYLDKNFLKELPFMPGITSPNYKGIKEIKKLCRNALKMLTVKQEILRSRRPFYFIKFQKSLLPPNLQKKLEAERLARAKCCIIKADKLLEQLEDDVIEEKLVKATEVAWKLWTFCKHSTKNYLPEREEYLKKIYALLGE